MTLSLQLYDVCSYKFHLFKVDPYDMFENLTYCSPTTLLVLNILAQEFIMGTNFPYSKPQVKTLKQIQ